MGKTGVKRKLFERFALVGGAMASASRLELLELLAQGEKSVEALAQAAGLSIANASQHLHRLRGAGLVTSRKEGQKVFYALGDEAVVDLMNVVVKIAERTQSEVDALVTAFLKDKDGLEPVAARELLARARKGEITVLDVRPEDEFAAGHIKGAVNIPLSSLEARLKELDVQKEVVAYCRGPYCVMAYEAVARLRKGGLKARRLDEGFPGWKRSRHPVED